MIETCEEMLRTIERIGYLPYIGSKKGMLFSLEEYTENEWFTGKEDDPWEWRHIAASGDRAAYGKFFLGNAGFVARTRIPAFIALRRENRSEEELYGSGCLSEAAHRLYRCFDGMPFLSSVALKRRSGLEKAAFDRGQNELQMLFLLCISGCTQRKNKNGEPYGWSVNEYARIETLYPQEPEEALSSEEACELLLRDAGKAGFFAEKDVRRLLLGGRISR